MYTKVNGRFSIVPREPSLAIHLPGGRDHNGIRTRKFRIDTDVSLHGGLPRSSYRYQRITLALSRSRERRLARDH